MSEFVGTNPSMNFKILYVIASVHPKSGGPVEGVRQMTHINRSAGHVIEVVTFDQPNAPYIQDFPAVVHGLGGGRRFDYIRRLVPWIRRNRSRFDAVIVNGIWGYNCYGAWRALRGSGIPYFVYPHGMLDPWFKRTYPLKHLKKWFFWPWAVYPALRDATAVLFTCEEERRLARQSFWLYKCREVVVNYGTPGASRRDYDYAVDFLAKHPELQGKRRFVFLGRVHPKKGPDILIKAFAQILAAHDPTFAVGSPSSEGNSSESPSSVPSERRGNAASARWGQHAPPADVPTPAPGLSDLQALDMRLAAPPPSPFVLIMAGPADGTYAAELKALAESLGVAERIYWTGMLLGDDKWGALQCAEAFLLPSHQENFGIAVAESLSVSVPVVISKSVNIWTEIVSAEAGLADDDTVEGCERSWKQWLSMSTEGKAAMRRNARLLFEQRYTSKRAADSLIEIIRGALAVCH